MTKPWRDLGRYGTVGLELVLGILILAGAGHWLDEHYWGRRGWGMGVGFVLGVGVGVRNLIRLAARMQKDIERAEAKDPQAGRWTVEEGWLHKPDPDGTSAATPRRGQQLGDDVAKAPDSEHTPSRGPRER